MVRGKVEACIDEVSRRIDRRIPHVPRVWIDPFPIAAGILIALCRIVGGIESILVIGLDAGDVCRPVAAGSFSSQGESLVGLRRILAKQHLHSRSVWRPDA